jgi:hypothetical protein
MEDTLRERYRDININGSRFITNGAPKLPGGRLPISPRSDRHSLEEIEAKIMQYSCFALADNYEHDSVVPLGREKR